MTWLAADSPLEAVNPSRTVLPSFTSRPKLLVAEGGPTLAGVLASLGLIDEFFLTIAPRVVAGTSGRVVHGPDADAEAWRLEDGLMDDDGFLFLRYVRASAPPSAATPKSV